MAITSWQRDLATATARRKPHWPTVFVAFVAGSLFDAFVLRPSCVKAELPRLEERGPPSKKELGQAGWTLLHTMAANYPDQPTAAQQARMEAFLHALGHLYPCPDCAAHFRRHTKVHPVDSRTREGLSRWLCEAHNDVNTRNGKEAFYCDLGVLDARWKDCGCGNSSESASMVSAASERRDVHPPLQYQPHAVSAHGRGARRRLH